PALPVSPPAHGIPPRRPTPGRAARSARRLAGSGGRAARPRPRARRHGRHGRGPPAATSRGARGRRRRPHSHRRAASGTRPPPTAMHRAAPGSPRCGWGPGSRRSAGSRGARTRAPRSVPNTRSPHAAPPRRAPGRGAAPLRRRAAPAPCARARPSFPGRSARSRRARARRPSLLEALADRATEGDLPVIDADVETALGVRADPGLVSDRRPVAAVVRQRNEETLLTFSAGGPLPDVVHAAPPSPDPTPAIRAPARATDIRPGTRPQTRRPARSP